MAPKSKSKKIKQVPNDVDGHIDQPPPKGKAGGKGKGKAAKADESQRGKRGDAAKQVVKTMKVRKVSAEAAAATGTDKEEDDEYDEPTITHGRIRARKPADKSKTAPPNNNNNNNNKRKRYDPDDDDNSSIATMSSTKFDDDDPIARIYVLLDRHARWCPFVRINEKMRTQQKYIQTLKTDYHELLGRHSDEDDKPSKQKKKREASKGAKKGPGSKKRVATAKKATVTARPIENTEDEDEEDAREVELETDRDGEDEGDVVVGGSSEQMSREEQKQRANSATTSSFPAAAKRNRFPGLTGYQRLSSKPSGVAHGGYSNGSERDEEENGALRRSPTDSEVGEELLSPGSTLAKR